MKIKLYKLHCSNCKPSRFISIKGNKVSVTLDLGKDEYRFIARCPKCGEKIINTRRAF